MSVGLTAVLLALGGEAIPIRVNYDAPVECPSGDAFYDAVSARTDHVRPAVGEEPRLDVTVRVTRDARGYAGEVREMVNGKESAVRSVDSETCKDVVEALSLTVALSIDPDAHAPVQKAQSTPVTPPAAHPENHRDNQGRSDTEGTEGSESNPVGSVAAAGSPAQLRLQIGVGAYGALLDTAGFGVGGALSATVLRESSTSTSSSVQLAVLFASTGFPSAPADHRAQLGALLLDACPFRRRFADIELAPCALASLGVLEVTGRAVSEAKTVDRAWWSAGLDAELSWLLGRGWVLEGALGATVPLVRRRYFTNDAEHVVAETPIVSPLGRLGLGFRF